MHKKEFVIEFQNTLKDMEEIMLKKNHDYGGDKDPFNNFRISELLGIAGVDTALLVRMSDKMARICTLIKKEGKVNDESINDTLIDLANYSIILNLYLKYGKQD